MPRLILLHKQKTSARTRFLCLADGVVLFAPLPALAALREPDYVSRIEYHPSAMLREAELQLGLAEGDLAAEPEFRAWVDTPDGDVPVLLGVFTAIDPPFAMAERQGGRFIALTEARPLSQVQRLLLQRVYEHVMG